MFRWVSYTPFLVTLLAASAAAQAQTVEEIVAKNLEAKGGAEKWNAITAVKMTGTFTREGMQLPMTVYAKRPNYTRQEMVLKDRKLVQAFDGTTGWLINPMISDAPQELPRHVSAMMQNTADFDGPLVDYKTKGHSIELVGREKLGASDVYHLKITMKTGQVQHYYLDAESGIELKKSEDVDLGQGQKQTFETEMSDYRPVDGVMVAHSVTQRINQKPVGQISIDNVEFNPVVDDSLFRMPDKSK